jgi:hypothetical protein
MIQDFFKASASPFSRSHEDVHDTMGESQLSSDAFETPQKTDASEDASMQQDTPDKALDDDDEDDEEVRFCMKLVIEIGKGEKTIAWVPETHAAEGRDFSTLHAKDRTLAKLIGLNCSDPAPFKLYDGLRFLRQERDSIVDAIIADHMKKSDPLGHTSVQVLNIKQRERAFDKANVPQVINVKVPMQGSEISMLMLSSRRKGVNVDVHVTQDVIKWLRRSVRMVFNIKVVDMSSAWVDEDLPELPQPFKYRKRCNAISVCRDYEDKDGKNRSIQKTLCQTKMLTERNKEYLRRIVEDACAEIEAKITTECNGDD